MNLKFDYSYCDNCGFMVYNLSKHLDRKECRGKKRNVKEVVE